VESTKTTFNEEKEKKKRKEQKLNSVKSRGTTNKWFNGNTKRIDIQWIYTTDRSIPLPESYIADESPAVQLRTDSDA
jgi:hypothetical protein